MLLFVIVVVVVVGGSEERRKELIVSKLSASFSSSMTPHPQRERQKAHQDNSKDELKEKSGSRAN